MRIAIVDDKAEDCEELHQLLNQYFSRTHLTVEYITFSSGLSLLKAFHPGRFDIVFMDIQMSDLSGMETARRIREEDSVCRIIFFTTSHTHAVESYSVRATYYLTKPVNFDLLSDALDLVCGDLARDNRYMTVHVAGVALEILMRDILYMDCRLERAQLHLADRMLQLDDRVGDLLVLLSEDERFLNCNRNVAVNMEHIERVSEGNFLLKNGESVPIRQRGRGAVKKAFLEYSLSPLRKRGNL